PRGPIGPIRPMVSLNPWGLPTATVPVLHPSPGHALADAAILEEVLLQAAKLLIEEIVRLVDQADSDVGDDLGGTRFTEGTKGLVGHAGLAAELADKCCFFGILRPELEVSDAEEISVINQELLKAGAGNVGELDFGLLRRAGGFAC